MRPNTRNDIVDAANFVLATRDTGYRSTASAVAELVDNSLQAEASNVSIFIAEDTNEDKNRVWLAALDNGTGMPPAALSRALQFGGSSRFNGRIGLGRFGMGLPNSSLSQCRHVDVFSWQDHQSIHHTYLDVDEIVAGKMKRVPPPLRATLPQWAVSQAGASGTLVVWTKCDRLDNRRPATIARKLHAPLGRKFRYFLWQGAQIKINGDPIRGIDPLFCHPSAQISGASEFCEPLQYEMRLPHGNEGVSLIRVRFSLLPVEQWHHWTNEMKQSAGLSGGAGVSIVRAGREIAFGWYFLAKRRKQNYDDWWRCEISFEPDLDEWFGVTHSKQGINPTPELESVLSHDITAIANRLNHLVREAFLQSKSRSSTAAAQKATSAEWVLPLLGQVSENNGDKVHGGQEARRVGYCVRLEAQSNPEFVTWSIDNGALVLTINENHPFYSKVYLPLLQQNDTKALFYLECMLLSYARSEARYATEDGHILTTQLRKDWSNALAVLLS